jgi:hypothetical protein
MVTVYSKVLTTFSVFFYIIWVANGLNVFVTEMRAPGDLFPGNKTETKQKL